LRLPRGRVLRISMLAGPLHYVPGDSHVSRACKSRHDAARKLWDEASTRLGQGDYRGAATLFRRLLPLLPARRAEILNNLGAALLKLPDGHAEAVRSFRAALALRPDHADLRRNLHVALCTYGLVLSGLGRLTEAVECFEEALRLDPRDDCARFLLAQ